MKLTPKQKRFCQEYVIDLNGTQAAIRAGYSKKTANIQAAQHLTKLSVQNYIQTLQEKKREKMEVTAEMVIAELAKVGFSNIQDLIEEGNTTKDISEISKDKAASVSSIKKITTSGGTEGNEWVKESVEFRLYDKVSALEKLGRHLGIFEKDNGQKSVTVKFPEWFDDGGKS